MCHSASCTANSAAELGSLNAVIPKSTDAETETLERTHASAADSYWHRRSPDSNGRNFARPRELLPDYGVGDTGFVRTGLPVKSEAIPMIRPPNCWPIARVAITW